MILAAFWWVGETSKLEEANVKVSKLKIGTFTIPMMENTKALRPGDKLMVLKPQPEPAKQPVQKKARTA